MKAEHTASFLNPQSGKLETIDVTTGEIIHVEGMELQPSKYVYCDKTADAICQLIREGKTLTKISQMRGMPPTSTIYRWKATVSEFAAMYKQARKDRAEYYHDMAVDALEDARDASKDDVPALKLRFDGHLKLAEKNSPDDFSPKQQQLQNGAAPTMIVINTGIDRSTPLTVETTHEEICIDQRSEDRLRGTYEGSKEKRSLGAEIEGLGSEEETHSRESGSGKSEEKSYEESIKESIEEGTTLF